MRYISILIVIFSSSVYAEECSEFQGSGDGVPAIYYQEKCMAERAFKDKKYALAAEHYGKASAVKIFEAPNYELRLEWAESLCLSGKQKEGKEKLESFVLMARADLGEFKCPENVLEIIGIEHMELACIGHGSSLSERGAVTLKKKLERSKEIRVVCENNA